MPIMSKEVSLSFDDVHLLATKPSIVESRSDIVVETYRIMTAPMNAIQNSGFIKEALRLGLSVPIHRFNTPEEQHKLVKVIAEQHIISPIECPGVDCTYPEVFLSVGLKLSDLKERLELNKELLKNSNNDHGTFGILLDVANGFSSQVAKTMLAISDWLDSNKFNSKYFPIMLGNINTKEGFHYLEKSAQYLNFEPYLTSIRCSIGTGTACETTLRTGYGRGMFTLIKELYEESHREACIIADGGLKSPGDISKAFLAGADYVMLGSYFKEAEEAECNVKGTNFFGGASKVAKQSVGADLHYVEGREVSVNRNQIKPLAELVREITDGVRSAVSYAGYDNLHESIGQGVFEVKGR